MGPLLESVEITNGRLLCGGYTNGMDALGRGCFAAAVLVDGVVVLVLLFQNEANTSAFVVMKLFSVGDSSSLSVLRRVCPSYDYHRYTVFNERPHIYFFFAAATATF